MLPRSRRLVLVRPIVLLVCGLTATSAAFRASALAAQAHATAAANVKDEGHLHLVRSSGSTLYDEGYAHGSLPGPVKVSFFYDGEPMVSAHITIDTRGGAIEAHGVARLSSPSSSAPSFKGTLTIASGSGRYAHAHGNGSFFGVFYRRSYALTVQTEGTLQS
jgi:hypothetical protein